MLELLGELCSCAFAVRTASGPINIGRITATYLTLVALVDGCCVSGLFPSEALGLEWPLVREEGQVWRLVTSFFYCDAYGLSFAIQLYLFSIYSSLLESRHFFNSELWYALTLCTGAAMILSLSALVSAIVGTTATLSLTHALSFYVIGLWSRSEPHKVYSILLIDQLAVRAAFVPWCLLGVLLPLTGSVAASYNLLGLCAALVHEIALGLPPPVSELKPAPAAAAASPVGEPNSERQARRPQSGGKAGGKAGGSKAALPGGRERWLSWGQVIAAVLLVAYHGGSRGTERRAERTLEMRTCRKLRDGMDGHGPMMVKLMAKLADARSTATADAGTILSTWSFAVEHWQQATSQKRSQTPVHNMSAADPEGTRQVIAQVLGRSELSEDQPEAEVVTEVYNQLGFGRLVVTPESVPYLMAAVGSFHEQRERTLAAWGFVKKVVHAGDDPTGIYDDPATVITADESAAIYSALNTSLAEYDLPTTMSDTAVLDELFSLLDMARDTVSLRVERRLLAAIRRHREERAVVMAARLHDVLTKVRAAALNDTSATDALGRPLLKLEEVWSLAACNETMNAVLVEALQLMEATIDTPDDEVWTRLLMLSNMSEADMQRALPLAVDETSDVASAAGSTILRAAFASTRARRASDARLQESFEELIAAVRAEDPNLAAEEERKSATLQRYEANRARWLGALLKRAAELGVAGAAEAAAKAATADAEYAARASTDGESAEARDAPEKTVDDSVEMSAESVAAWHAELERLQSKRAAGLKAGGAVSQEEAKEKEKHEHYARLLKLPRLVAETLSSWIDPTEDLSDKQIFHELLRMMGLVESVEPRLMRAMIEAVKQHRLRREREAIERGDWAEHGPESLAMRPGWRQAHPSSVRRASAMVNHAGDGSDFAVFVATLLHSIGAHVRLSLGCSKNITIPPPPPDGPPWAVAAHHAAVAAEPWRGETTQVCQLSAEVRLGRNPQKIQSWVRTWLPGSRWLGKTYFYRYDREGYAWLNLDWIDGAPLQRPGAPIKQFESTTIYYPHDLQWETEGEQLDSTGQPKPRNAPVEALKMGVR